MNFSKPMSEPATESAYLLVVSREPSTLRPLWAIGEANDWRLETADSGWEALERVRSGANPDLVLLDLARGDADGLYTLRWLRRVRPDLPIVLLSYSEDPRHRVEAIRLGALDYLVRPFDGPQLEMVIRQHLDVYNGGVDAEIASEDVERVSEEMFFIAASPIMRKLRAQAELLAQVNVPLLVVGETGSGKETIARLIHKLSVRSGFRFLKVNCSALPSDLLESELFGYERGQGHSNGARTKPGKFELCDKGTILLDDIDQMPAALQAKLLHVLQTHQFSRVGGESTIETDVRIMASTSANTEQAMADQQLREDLYYQLSAFTVHVPPLRQRKDEIPLFLGHFMNQLARHYGLPARTFSVSVMDSCQHYSWPGNLRELEKLVKRYLVIGDDGISPGDIEHEFGGVAHDLHPASKPGHGLVTEVTDYDDNPSGLKSLVQSVKGEAERNAIATALEQTRWNRKAAARLLKVSYRTLLYKIQQYHMSPPTGYLSSFLSGNGLKNNNGHER